MEKLVLNNLQALEAESIHAIRETAAEFERPVMLYSAGKDSSVLLRLARKAFYPGCIPFPLLHVDTTLKFAGDVRLPRRGGTGGGGGPQSIREPRGARRRRKPVRPRHGAMLRTPQDQGAPGGHQGGRLHRGHRGREARGGAIPRQRAHMVGARRARPMVAEVANGRSRGTCATRISRPARRCASFRSPTGRSSTSGCTSTASASRSCRCTWPGGAKWCSAESAFIALGAGVAPVDGEEVKTLSVRFRTLGCQPCTGAVRSSARTVEEVIRETASMRRSERDTRIIDHDVDGSMERKKTEGYF